MEIHEVNSLALEPTQTRVEGEALAQGRWRAFRAFRHPAFRVIWFGYLASQAGFWIGSLSLQWLMARLTGGDPLALGLLFFCSFAPLPLLSLPSGLLADRFDRRVLAITGQLTVAVVAGLIAVMTYAHLITEPVLLGLAMLLGAAGAVGGPAGQAVVANSVPPADIGSAVSLQAAGMNLGRISGPAVAAPVLIAFGAAPTFAITAVANVVTSVALIRARLNPIAPAKITRGRLRQLVEGFIHAAERPPAATFLLMVAVNMLFATSYLALLPTIAYQVLRAGDLGFSTLIIGTGVGAAVGAATAGHREGPARVRTVALQMVAQAVVLAAFGLSHWYPLTLILTVVLGALVYQTLTAISASLQYLADEQKRGRLLGAYMIVGPGAVPVGGLLLGSLAHIIGPADALLSFAAVSGLFSVALALREASPRITTG